MLYANMHAFICVHMQIYTSYATYTVKMDLSSTKFQNFIKHTGINIKIQHRVQCDLLKFNFIFIHHFKFNSIFNYINILLIS